MLYHPGGSSGAKLVRALVYRFFLGGQEPGSMLGRDWVFGIWEDSVCRNILGAWTMSTRWWSGGLAGGVINEAGFITLVNLVSWSG